MRSPGGKLLLTTPERMADPEFRVFLREACGGVGVSRFVVDEAHCVSQWGHDFRPAYLSLRKAIEDVGRPPVLATTATAPPHVRDDILFQLGIEKATIVTTTFDRPNLHYEVIIFSRRRREDEDARHAAQEAAAAGHRVLRDGQEGRGALRGADALGRPGRRSTTAA